MSKSLEINSHLQLNYSKVGKFSDVTILKHNNINSTNYLCKTKNEQYVLHHFTDGSDPIKIEKICRILEFCSKNKIKVIKPIRNDHHFYVNNKEWTYLTKYYIGEAYHGRSSELKDVAKNLALLHKTLGYSKYRLSQTQSTINLYKLLNLKELKKIKQMIIIKKHRQRIDNSILVHLDFLAEQFLLLKKYDHIISKIKFKRQLIHRDLHPRNIIFKKNKVHAILDFNDLATGKLIEDISFACFRFSIDKSTSIREIIQKIELFLKTYNNNNRINIQNFIHMKYFFTREVLRRISYICRTRYFLNGDNWSSDFTKLVRFLKLADSISESTEYSRIISRMC